MNLAKALGRLRAALDMLPKDLIRITVLREDLEALLADWESLEEVRLSVLERAKRERVAKPKAGEIVSAHSSGIRWYCVFLNGYFTIIAERDTQNATVRESRAIHKSEWINTSNQRALFAQHIEHLTHAVIGWS